MDVTALRQAGQVGQTYSVVNTVAPGTGCLWHRLCTWSTQDDHRGGRLGRFGPPEGSLKNIPLLEEDVLTLDYSGPLAGNVESVQGLISMRPQRYTLLSLEAGWQKPLVGVNPSVIIGTPGVNSGLVPGTGPRPYGSPVAVVDDLITGSNNREMTWLTATIGIQSWPRVVL